MRVRLCARLCLSLSLSLSLPPSPSQVIYPDPGFPAYETTIEWSGATPVPLRLSEESGFSFCHDELRRIASPKTKLIIICSPGNPTGCKTIRYLFIEFIY